MASTPGASSVAPSTLAVVGRYILTANIFEHLENLGTGSGGEIQLTDGIAALMESERVLAYRYAGQRYDCGSKLGYLTAMTAMGLKHPETAEGYRAFLKQIHQEQETAAQRADTWSNACRSARTASIMLSPAVFASVYGCTPGEPRP